MFILIFAVSCSSGTGDAVAPTTGDKAPVTLHTGNTSCIGFWQVEIDEESSTINAVDMRSSDLIIDVLGFLEPPALKGLTIDFATLKIADPVIEVDVILTHPIPDPTFTGFDVRGVVFGPRVTNADGLTIVSCPEFFAGIPFGYKDGLLGTPDSVANYKGLAGYKYFCDGLGKDDDLATFMSDPDNLAKRGIFSQGPKKNARHYVLDWTGASHPFFVFNYAVYANWNWPVGEPPIDIDDFEITTANSQEAFCCKVTELANSLYYEEGSGGGGSISLQVEVWDWLGNINNATVESLEEGIIAQASWDDVGPGMTSKSSIYDFLDVPGTPTKKGNLDILVTVTDDKTFGESWLMGLLPSDNPKYYERIYNCFIYTASVVECPVPVFLSSDPPFGAGILDDVKFNCKNLVDGPSLGVKLKKGATEWPGTDVHYQNSALMTADLDLTGAAFGDKLDVVITNGCGTQGTAAEAWEVYYYIGVVDDPNIDIKTGFGAPKDIAIDPSSDRVAITYTDPNGWRKWTDDYTSSTGYSPAEGKVISYWDAQSEFFYFGFDYLEDNRYYYFSWDDWNGSGAPWYAYADASYGARDVANIQGANELIMLYDIPGAPYGYCSFIRMDGIGIDHYQGFYAFGLPPWYNGTGTTGVIMENLRAIDFAKYGGGGNYILYTLETLSDTGVVEKWGFGQYTMAPIYLDVSFGEDFLYNPLDITVDSNDFVYVLEKKSDGSPAIWAYTTDGMRVGSSGPLSTAQISGDPLRVDAFLSSDPDEVHVLHSKGVTKFAMQGA